MFNKIPLVDDLTHAELLTLCRDKFAKLDTVITGPERSALLVNLQALRESSGNDRLTLVEFLMADFGLKS